MRYSPSLLALLAARTRWQPAPMACLNSDAPNAVVVGAGVGGLYTAARLAKAGVKTTLVEQNPREDAGGRLETIWLDAAGRRFRFEVGPSLLLLPGVYREALETLGLDPDAHLDLARVAPAYAVHYRDGGPTPLEIGGDAQAEARLQAAMDGVEPGAHASFRAYMDAAQANLHAGLPIFIKEQLTPDSLSRLPRFLSAALLGGGGPTARRSVPLVDWPLRTHAAQLEARFDAPRHQALLGFQDLYVGLPPAEAPAVFSLLQAIELEEQGDDGAPLGVYYPTGGFGTFRDALLAACEAAGVELRFGTRVAAVEVEEGQVVGVRLAKADGSATACEAGGGGGEGGELLGAGCVVVNADVAAAEGALLAPHLRRSGYDELSEVGGGDGPLETGEARAAAVAGAAAVGEGVGVGGVLAAAASAVRGEDRPWRYSTSSVTFLFCLDKRFEQLRHHNVFLAPPEAWGGLFDASSFSGWGAAGGGGEAGGGAEGGGAAEGAPFHFYVAAPARTDPSVVERAADDAVMALVPVPPIDERLSAEAQAEACAAAVARARKGVLAAFEAAGMAGFAGHVVREQVRTPLEWRDKYALRRGAVFGLSHNLAQLSLLRPARRHPGAHGLHWVGASTRPGNGVPLVLIGAELAAAEALQDLGVTEPGSLA